MKILSIGSDRKLFEENSKIFQRLVSYASKVEEMHVVVFTKTGYKPKAFGNLYIHPTNSVTRLHYVFDAKKIGEEIIKTRTFSVTDSVITTQDPFESGLVGHLLHKKSHLPFQIQIHTDFLSPNFRNGILNRVRVFIAKFIIPKAQGIRVVSDAVKASIEENFPKLKPEVSVLPVFVDIKSIIDTIPEKSLEKEFPQFKFIIFMASRLSKEKRIDVALRSVKKIIGEFPKTGLVIAGSGSEKRKLESLASQLGLEKNVVFLGWQDNLISYFKTADLYLLTSDYEGYGMTLVEAGVSGCPIVTTKVGLAKTSLFKNNQNSQVCDVGDIKCISEAILTLIHNNQKREEFKREMQKDLTQVFMSKEEYALRYIELLKNLIVKK